ncbi:MAG: hypothetical protein ABIW76_08205 [Fibrobacteria bacterium]
MNNYWIFAAPLLLAGFCQAWTKEEVYEKLATERSHSLVAYHAKVSSTIKYGEMAALNDSGSMSFSPPNCFKMIMYKAGTENSGCGDTTWSKTKDGKVTRSVEPGGAEAGAPKSPNLKDMLRGMDFRILGDKPNGNLEIEATLKQDGMSIKANMLLDTRKWLLKRMSFTTPQGETMEIGYNYRELAGEDIMSEINTVFGTGGFVRMKFIDFKKISPLPSKDFKIF